MQQRKLFLIIDGSSLLSTSFYGTVGPAYLMAKTEEDRAKALEKLLKTSDGRYTNGVYTFMKTLLNLIKNQKPTHMAIVWDRTRQTFRQNISGVDGSYKGNRKSTPDALSQQFKTTQDLLEGIIPQFLSSMDDDMIYEADDFAGSLARKFEEEVPVVLLTKDMDYLQLISEHTKAWIVTSKADEMFAKYGINPKDFEIPAGAFEYTMKSFADEIGLNHPSEFIDAKAIMGDKSDNIPGVHGVGDKAAIPLVKEYGTLENIYNTIEGLTPKEEKELKKFFKESLGISRSPIAYMLKEGSIELSNGEKLSYKCIPGDLTDEQKDIQAIVKSKIGELRFPIEITTSDGISKLQNGEVVGINLSAKESAFMSKELAKIVTDIPSVQSASLDDIKLNINRELLKERLLDLEIKSLEI